MRFLPYAELFISASRMQIMYIKKRGMHNTSDALRLWVLHICIALCPLKYPIAHCMLFPKWRRRYYKKTDSYPFKSTQLLQVWATRAITKNQLYVCIDLEIFAYFSGRVWECVCVLSGCGLFSPEYIYIYCGESFVCEKVCCRWKLWGIYSSMDNLKKKK